MTWDVTMHDVYRSLLITVVSLILIVGSNSIRARRERKRQEREEQERRDQRGNCP